MRSSCAHVQLVCLVSTVITREMSWVHDGPHAWRQLCTGRRGQRAACAECRTGQEGVLMLTTDQLTNDNDNYTTTTLSVFIYESTCGGMR
jgi:hypothetical protein